MLIELRGYKNLEKISEGITTTIYRGEHIRDRKIVVIVVLNNQYPSLSELNKFRNQFLFLRRGLSKVHLNKYEVIDHSENLDYRYKTCFESIFRCFAFLNKYFIR